MADEVKKEEKEQEEKEQEKAGGGEGLSLVTGSSTDFRLRLLTGRHVTQSNHILAHTSCDTNISPNKQ